MSCIAIPKWQQCYNNKRTLFKQAHATVFTPCGGTVLMFESHFLFCFQWATLRMERGAKEKNQHLYKPNSNGKSQKIYSHWFPPMHHFWSIIETLVSLCQASSLKSRRPSNRRSRKWDAAGQARSPSSTCLISFIFAGKAWRASWTMKWPNAFQRRSWSPGTCWPAATTTRTTSAPDSQCSGGWECSFAMGFYCHSGEKMDGCVWLNVATLVVLKWVIIALGE